MGGSFRPAAQRSLRSERAWGRRRRTPGAAVVGAPCQEGRGLRSAHAEEEKEGAGRACESEPQEKGARPPPPPSSGERLE